MKLLKKLVVFLLMLGIGFSPTPEAGRLGKVFARSVMKKILRRDLVRDAATAAKPLAKPRTVFRYTSKVRVRQEARLGLQPGARTTSVAQPGRPLSATSAQRRYGLPSRPQVRETVRIQDQKVRFTKVLGGESGGFGEMTSPKKIPADAIRRTVPLR